MDDGRTEKTGAGRELCEGQRRPRASGGATCTRPPGARLGLGLSSMQRKAVKIIKHEEEILSSNKCHKGKAEKSNEHGEEL